MAVEKVRYAGLDLGKRTWEMAVIIQSGKFKVNEQGDAEPEEKTVRYSRSTAAEGRLKRYIVLLPKRYQFKNGGNVSIAGMTLTPWGCLGQDVAASGGHRNCARDWRGGATTGGHRSRHGTESPQSPVSGVAENAPSYSFI
jgi:hypothetical protein